jgi:3-oxoacyl-[acyl-carrier protein] reductase
MDLSLRGKHALVTGGSRGIGRSIALELAREGAIVVACYQHESAEAASLREILHQFHKENLVIQADVADEASVERLVDTVRGHCGSLDILVNNAGIVNHATLNEMSLEQWRSVLDTNLTSMYLVTHAAQRLLTSGASVVNISSAVAGVGMPGRTHYTAAKAGVIGFTRSLCKELGPRSIRVNAIAPGIIDTDQARGLTEAQRTRYASMAALNRLGLPVDIARAVLFLVSDLSSFVSGITLTVDGGI